MYADFTGPDGVPYNVEIIPGKGDNDDLWLRTRCFNIANQCETGYWPAFRRPYFPVGLFDKPHWSDPVYYPA